jgi:hypothetical protein
VTHPSRPSGHGNQIFTLVTGSATVPGRYDRSLTLYSLLRTVEEWYGLPTLGGAATAPALPNAWVG